MQNYDFLRPLLRPATLFCGETISYVKIQDSYSGEEKEKCHCVNAYTHESRRFFFLTDWQVLKHVSRIWQTCPINFEVCALNEYSKYATIAQRKIENRQ